MTSGSECGCASTLDTTGMRGTETVVFASAPCSFSTAGCTRGMPSSIAVGSCALALQTRECSYYVGRGLQREGTFRQQSRRMELPQATCPIYPAIYAPVQAPCAQTPCALAHAAYAFRRARCERVPRTCMKSVWKAPATDSRTVMRALNSGLAIFSAASQPCHTHPYLLQCALPASKSMTG